MSVTPTTVAGRFAAILGVFTWGGLTTRLLAEPARWVLWLPVALGGGIALFFALPKDPPNGAGWLALTVAALVALVGRRSPPVLVAALAVAVASGGFTIVQHRAATQAAPILERRLPASEVTARVVEVARLPQGLRLALEEVRIEGLAEAKTPKRVRVTARKEVDFVPRPGDIVSVRALLQPPPAPSMPGAYDFAREAYFQRLGAVGSAHGPLRLIEETNARPGGLRLVLENLRETMTRRIFSALPEGQAAIAAALITGDQLAIPKESLAAWRDSGL
ncbi:MAG: DUF4131 domain-containing protein, partial [Alphaproteobacteria bacterium]|nr:DUF4131 domain-containing protein [Alphaproteobacteria bacterium]